MNPYLQLKSYTEKDAAIFKGRKTEINDLLNILKRNDIAVLYSESAEGKSSLLGAGLFPRLRQRGFIPVNIVFTDDEFKCPEPDFDRIIISRIEAAMKEGNDGTAPAAPSYAVTVNESQNYEWVCQCDLDGVDAGRLDPLKAKAWWLLRNFAIERFGAKYYPVLIFDQFEEVFTIPPIEWTDRLFAWMQDVYSDTCPAPVADILREIAESNDGMLPPFGTARRFKEVISMRSEFLGDLDYWGVQRHFMPELKNSRYCLKPLTLTEAEEVLDLGFKDDDATRAKILRAVTGRPAEALEKADPTLPIVPAMLLSVICGTLCDSNNKKSSYSVLLDKYSDKALTKIIIDFYLSIIRDCKISDSARRTIEEALIDEKGKRIRTKADTRALRSIGFAKKYLSPLKHKGIIKTSKINGETYVEFVHDQLAKAIHSHHTDKAKTRRTIVGAFLICVLSFAAFVGWLEYSSHYSRIGEIPSSDAINYYFALNTHQQTLESDSGNSIENNSFVETYTYLGDSHSFDAEIKGCPKLRTLVIRRNKHVVKFNISDCALLRDIFISDSVKNLTLNIDDNIGFCEVHIGKGVTDLTIKDRKSDCVFKPSTDDYITDSHGCLWNIPEQRLVYVPGNFLRNNICFNFPEQIQRPSIIYNWIHPLYNFPYGTAIPSKTVITTGNFIFNYLAKDARGTLDLSSFTELKYIPYKAFEGSLMDSVILPPNLQEIGNYAFDKCINLKYVSIPPGVKKVNAYSFPENCKIIDNSQFSTDEIELSEDGRKVIELAKPYRTGTLDLSDFMRVTAIGRTVFNNCRFDSIILPPNIRSFEFNDFRSCPNLKYIFIPQSLEEGRYSHFNNNCDVDFRGKFSVNKLTIEDDTIITSIHIPFYRGTLDLRELTKVTEIKDFAFSKCLFDTIILPPNIKNIDPSAFSFCSDLKHIETSACLNPIKIPTPNDIHILTPDSCRNIDIGPYRFCRGTLNLSKITKRFIDNEAFSGFQMDSIMLNENLEYIGCQAFADCPNLRNVTLPKSIKKVAESAFDSHCGITTEDNRPLSDIFVPDKVYKNNIRNSLAIDNTNTGESIYFLPNFFVKALTDSIITLFEPSKAYQIRHLHLPYPKPELLIYNRKDSIHGQTYRYASLKIDIPDKTKAHIVLHVPYGSRQYYMESSEFKAFQNIEEDSRIQHYMNLFHFHFLQIIGWYKANILTINAAILAVIFVFGLLYRKRYISIHPEATNVKVWSVSIFNGTLMALVAVFSFIASYWWAWILSGSNYWISLSTGIIVALGALLLCYHSTLSVIIESTAKISRTLFQRIKALF